MKKYDIAIVVMPFVKPAPQTGPAILKAVLQKEGFKCKVIDWNFDLSKRAGKQIHRNIFGQFDPVMTKFLEKNFDDILLEWIDELKLLNLKWIGLSIFSFRGVKLIVEKICEQLKIHLPKVKVVAGGHAVSMIDYPLGDVLLKKNLIDCYIGGDGEKAIVSLLRNEKNIKFINNANDPYQLDSLDNFPIPDYSDTPINNYKTEAYIITSRGCLNRCKFCTGYYKKVILKKPEDVLDEIIDINQKYNQVGFFFADSLSNANAKHTLKIANLVIDANVKNILPKIYWICDWVCRSKKIINEEIYQKISKAGCREIYVGIESGSTKVRLDMRKPMKNEDIMFMVEQCVKENIILHPLFIIGYYTETKNQWLETLSLIKEINLINKTIRINVGRPYILISSRHKNIKYDKHKNWYHKDNTFPERCERWIKTIIFCKSLDIFVIYFYKDHLLNLLSVYEKTPYIKKIIKLFESVK